MNIKHLLLAALCALTTACAPFTPAEQAEADRINAMRQAERDKICQFPGTCFKAERGPASRPGEGITGGSHR